MAEFTQEKQAILNKALASPDEPNSKIVIAKARERGWLNESAKTDTTTNATSTKEALGLGAAQGATFGFQPAISAAIEKAAGTITGNEAYKGKSFADLVRENKGQVATAKAEHPAAFSIGDIAGSLSTTAPLTALTTAKAAGLAAKVGRFSPAVKVGAAGLQGAGEGALRAVGEGGNVKKAATTGAILGASGEAAASTVSAIAKGIKSIGKNLAEETVVKATGFDPMALRRMREKGDLLTEAKSIGRTLLDQGVLDKPQTARAAHGKVSKILEDTGKKLGDIYKDADAIVPEGLLNKNEIVSVIEDKLLSASQFPDIGAISNVSDDISNLLVTLPDKKLGFDKIHKFIVELERRANIWGRASDPAFASKADNLSEAALALRNFLGDSMQVASPELRDAHKIASSIYHDLSRAETALANKVLKDFSKNKSLPRQGLYESIIDATVGSSPVKGATAGALDFASKAADKAGRAGAGSIRGLSQALAGKGK